MSEGAWNPMAQRYERPTLTLAEFLLARIAEDEAAARAASEGGDSNWAAWVVGNPHPGTGTLVVKDRGRPAEVASEVVAECAPHIARHDPARVLAECEAKRRIIKLADDASVLDASLDAEFSGTIGYKGGGPDVGDRILRALALPYADHPDYRDEWRP